MLTVFWEGKLFGTSKECKTSRISGQYFHLENRINIKKLSEIFLQLMLPLLKLLLARPCCCPADLLMDTKGPQNSRIQPCKTEGLLLRSSYKMSFHIYDFLKRRLRGIAKYRDFQKTLPSTTICIV